MDGSRIDHRDWGLRQRRRRRIHNPSATNHLHSYGQFGHPGQRRRHHRHSR